MTTEFVTLQAADHLDLAEDVMNLGRIRHMPVLEDGRLVGIVSERDLLASSLSKSLEFGDRERRTFMKSVDVSEVMTGDVIYVEPSTPIREAARTMIRQRIGCLPVVDERGEPVGLITETDLLRAAYPALDDAPEEREVEPQ
jgi:CBS domain-containing protein